MTHRFNVNVANKVGVNKALLLHHINYWCEYNQEKNKNLVKKRHWMYMSSPKFEVVFPYMNQRTIRRMLVELETQGWLISGTYNKKGYDKTKWYCLTSLYSNLIEDDENFTDEYQESLREELNEMYNIDSIDEDCFVISYPSDYQEDETCGQTDQGSGQNDRPIPDTIISNSYINNCSTNSYSNTVNAHAREEQNKEVEQEEKNEKLSIDDLKQIPNKVLIKKMRRSEKSRNIFDSARKLFPGRKSGLNIEFENFLSKYNRSSWNEYNVAIDLMRLEKAIKKQILFREVEQKMDPKRFIPQWKNFKTWINNRSWEEENPEVEAYLKKKLEKEQENKSKPSFEDIYENSWANNVEQGATAKTKF